ncbi:MAG: hypothetical protein PVG39_00260 [Desulfobacteraceae bacterium]|jgi:hypothetical protein
MEENKLVNQEGSTMNIFKMLANTILYKGSKVADSMVIEAKSRAKEARDVTQQKIENVYAQLNSCVERGDRWFLVPNTPIDECGREDK